MPANYQGCGIDECINCGKPLDRKHGHEERQCCPCGSGQYSEWQHDARGIELWRTCDKCHDEKMGGYRQEVLTDGNYAANEPIEPEDY